MEQAPASAKISLVAPSWSPASDDIQHAWHEIRRRPTWKSLALVAVDEGAPPVALAQAFGEIASVEMTKGVLVVDVSTQGCAASGAQKAGEAAGDWQDLLRRDRSSLVALGEHTDFLELARCDRNRAARILVNTPRTLGDLTNGSLGYDGAIFALDSVVSHPTSIYLARAVDAVVLCVKLGVTSLDAIRRVTKIIGFERILGVIVLRSRG